LAKNVILDAGRHRKSDFVWMCAARRIRTEHAEERTLQSKRFCGMGQEAIGWVLGNRTLESGTPTVRTASKYRPIPWLTHRRSTPHAVKPNALCGSPLAIGRRARQVNSLESCFPKYESQKFQWKVDNPSLQQLARGNSGLEKSLPGGGAEKTRTQYDDCEILEDAAAVAGYCGNAGNG
jgi:hypothetical protein